MHIESDGFFWVGGGSQELISILLHNLAHNSTRLKHAADLELAQEKRVSVPGMIVSKRKYDQLQS